MYPKRDNIQLECCVRGFLDAFVGLIGNKAAGERDLEACNHE